jgi:hypothetical protein
MGVEARLFKVNNTNGNSPARKRRVQLEITEPAGDAVGRPASSYLFPGVRARAAGATCGRRPVVDGETADFRVSAPSVA